MGKKGYGEFIKRHRILSGYRNQKQFADVTGISSATISRIESEIQKPMVETLKEIAPHLKTTSIFELMAICDYLDSEEALEYATRPEHLFINDKSRNYERSEYLTDSKIKTPSNEEAFVHNIDLADSDILNKFKLELDGKELTEEEAKTIISYVRFLRSQN